MSKFDILIPQPVAPADVFRFGVITAIQPLRVKLDGDTAQLEVTPIITAETGGIGSRVLVQIHNRQLMIVGRVGGAVKILGASENLNDKEYTGFFHQPLSAQAGTGSNYPAATAGMLEVVRGSSGGQIFQRYTNYLSGNVWIRSRYLGTWNAWKNVLSEGEDGKATVNRLRIIATDDASETSTAHGFQIGPDSGFNSVMDVNEIIARNNGADSNFTIGGLLVALQGHGVGSTFSGCLEDMNGVSGSRRAGMKNQSGDAYFQVEGMWTATNAANCYVNTSGTMYRSTSVRAAKLAIEDISEEQLDALAEIRVRTWFDKRDAEALADDMTNGTQERAEAGPLKRIPGVIAEEIEALGLEEFLLRGEGGQLEGVAYDRLALGAYALIERQRKRLDAQDKLIADLVKRLDKLEKGEG